MKRIVKFALMVFLGANCAWLGAQVTTSTLSGVVTDATGAVIPGATLNLENVDNHVVRTETSGSDGSFHFEFVVVGQFQLTIVHPGFRTERLTGLQLNAAEPVNLPLLADRDTVVVVKNMAGVSVAVHHILHVLDLDRARRPRVARRSD